MSLKNSKEFTNKKVAVLGFGIEGESTAKYLLKQDSGLTVFDEKNRNKFDNAKIADFEKKQVEFHFGEFPQDFDNFDILVRSPGVKLDKILHTPGVGRRRNTTPGVEQTVITSPTKIFFDLCPAKIIGVTGTKGKGTTSSLIYEMLKAQGLDAYLGGNIGTPALDFLDKLSTESWVVLELSSFQLHDLGKSPADAKAMAGKPHITVVLMMTREHLDYHKDVSEYIEAKRNIVRFQDYSGFTIVNRDYPASNESDVFTNAKVYQVSREQGVLEGCYVKDGKVMLRINHPYKSEIRNSKSETITKTRNSNDKNVLNFENLDLEFVSSFDIRASNFSLATKDIEVIDVKDVLLPGKHNLENVCAAVMAAYLAGVSKQNIVKVLKKFRGLEHRIEFVATINGVKYYDDSFSTTPETAIAAIEAFSEPEILILGGSSKGSDFTSLGQVISNSKNIKAIIGIGVEWPRIKSRIMNNESRITIIEGLKDMPSIVKKASEVAQPGDVVLLSPACASFDMFKNYKDRGEQLKQKVLRLKDLSVSEEKLKT